MAEEKKEFQAEIVKPVSVSVLQCKSGIPVHVRIMEKIHTGKPMKAKDGEPEKKPAEIGMVVNLENGKPHTFVYGTVLRSQLEELYPEAGYVGLCFKIVKLTKREGKNYNDYEVYQIKDPAASDGKKKS